MSVNTAHANGGVLIHAGETILLFSNNVVVDFFGQDGAIFKGTKQGRIYLTTHRVIFNSKNAKDPMQSFSSPFVSMSEVELEQPVFGANYIKGKIRAQPNGNFTGEVKVKISFKSGGCIDFGQALLRAASMAQRNSNGMAPPPYEPPGNGWYAAPPPAYTPQAGTFGWLPNNSAFTQPTDGVFMSDLPPPYPGINANQGPGVPNQAPGYPNQAPGYPGVPNQAPGYTNQGPGFPNQGPGFPNQGPGYPNQAPGFPNQAPGYAPPGYAPTGQNGFQQQPYAGGSSQVYPNLPSQPFGYSAPSAPMSKEQEAASSAFYDPRNPTSAFVPNPNQFEMPPSYDSLNNPNAKKTQ